MSSRIVSKEAAQALGPIQWKRVDGPPGQSMAPTPGGGAAERPDGPDTAELEQQIAQLQREVTAREAQARQAGFQEGESATAAKLQQPLQEAADRLAAEVTELATVRQTFRRNAEQDLVRLAIAVARRVLHRELTADPNAIQGIVKAALEQLDAREVLRIRIHPDVAGLVDRALQARGAPEKIEVVPDGSLERGGIVVETSRGALDGSIEAQLMEIERGFVDLVRRS